MIKYHILGLLTLVAAAISGIEILAIYYEAPTTYLFLGKFWLMLILFGSSIAMYFRMRRFRKSALQEGKR